jgi:hypothetical protein
MNLEAVRFPGVAAQTPGYHLATPPGSLIP